MHANFEIALNVIFKSQPTGNNIILIYLLYTKI